jgi:hypothetical protein
MGGSRLILVETFAIFKDGSGADDVVGGGFAAGGLEGDAHGKRCHWAGCDLLQNKSANLNFQANKDDIYLTIP